MIITPENDIEYRTADEINEYQCRRLREAVEYAYARSPYYRRMFDENGIAPGEIQTIDDLQRLPFTEKSDLQRHNADFICVPRDRIVDYITTSGTLGDPVTFVCTDADLERLAYNEMKSFASAGVRPGDVVQLMTTIDKRFMAGLAYFLGVRKLGAGIVRVGNGIPELQWDTIERIKPDTIMCVPSFIPRLIEYAKAHGIDWRASSIRRIIGIGEGLRDQEFGLNLLGRRIHELWDVELYATYSSTEMGATFAECPYGCGGHVHPELIIVEIIGDDNRPVPDGVPGEVVVTTLGVEGMPLIRFRTGDICVRHGEQCRCGRSAYRLSPLVGRKNNMIKLKGTTIYPPAINDVLDNAEYVTGYQVEVTLTDEGTDRVIVHVAIDGSRRDASATVKELKDRFRSRLRVAPEVVIEEGDTLQRRLMPAGMRKPVKFVDNRGKSGRI